MNRIKNFILYSTLTVVGLYFLFGALIYAKSFFVPLVIAILLAMLVVPVASKLEKLGVSRGWAAFFSDLLLVGFTVLLLWVVGLQIKKIKEDWPQLKKELVKQSKKLDKSLDQFSWLQGNKGISFEQKLKSFTNQGQQSETNTGNKDSTQKGEAQSDSPSQSATGQTAKSEGGQGMSGSGIRSVLKSFFGFIGSMLLVFIYIFFFLLYRSKFKKSLLKFVPDQHKENTREIVNDSAHIAQQYLWGKFILIIFLAIFYSIGLSIAGIKYAIFISVIAAVLSLLPYIGNIIGAIFAAVMALLATGSGMGPLIGVTITFSITQFIESYILEPYIVGHKVDMNPVMTIVVVVFGEFIWGLPGMILAIPVLGIVKVIADHISYLRPIGYTIGEEGIEGGDNFFEEFEKWIKKKF